MITVHHLNESRSSRVIWLLEELNMHYELVTHQRDPQTRLAPESLQKVHPLAKAPVIIDGDTTLCESGAIMEYILDKDTQNKLRPQSGTPEYYCYLEWLHFAEGSLSLPVISTLLMGMEQREGNQPMDGYIGKEIALDFGYIENTLSQSPYLAGEQFTAADIMMAFILEVAKKLQLLTDKPNTLAYLEKLHERPAYIKIVQAG